MKEVFIVSAVRTPMGSFMGSLSSIPAPALGATAIRGAIDRIGINASEVEEVFMGNVVQAGEGQAPARQSAILAGLSDVVPCTTINKVCASGMKAVMLAAQAIKSGDISLAVAGGMENMSQTPHYLGGRKGVKLGNINMEDGMVKDGLTDAYSGEHMGKLAERCAEKYGITRAEQDAFAITSYKRSAEAWAEGRFNDEIVPVTVPQRKGEPLIISEDEEYKQVDFNKISSLRPVFKDGGTVTAANASTINDGASALVLVSREQMEALGLKPLARILSYADAAGAPKWFTTAPSKALPLAVRKANLSIEDIDYFELNEAFSVVGLVNIQLLGISSDRVNINGGAVALGHPLGSSGARIIVSLLSVLKQQNARYGAAAICNGGGGASAIVIENLQ